MLVQPQQIKQAVAILREGGLVAIPTETVYGLGADARNPFALRKIFAAKERPINHPLIVHLADISQLIEWASDISSHAYALANAFWPGPLTLILKKKPHVLDEITGGQTTVGLRIPNHPVAQAVLQSFQGGIAAPSANRFGRISPTTAEAVYEELGDRVDLILEGGQCEVGLESTIVDVSGDAPAILRPGMITAAQIERVLHQVLHKAQKDAPRVSGSLLSHYAPITSLHLVAVENLRTYLRELRQHEKPVAVLEMENAVIQQEKIMGVEYFSLSSHPEQYAHDLYSVLRMLDKKGYQQIVVQAVPPDLEWDAIRDRLQRAAV